MTFRQALLVLWRQRLLIVAAVVLAALAAAAFLYTRSPSFEASATVQTPQPGTTQQQTSGGPNLQLITSDNVVAMAARTLHRQDLSALSGAVSSSYDAGTNVVTITGSSSTASEAVKVANSFAGAYVVAQRSSAASELSQLQAQASKLNQQITTLTNKSQQSPKDNVLKTQLTNTTTLYSTVQTQILQAQIAPPAATVLHAATDAAPTGLSKVKVLLLAAAIGLLAGAGLALLRNQFDTRLRTVEDAEAVSGHIVLSQLPYVRAYRRMSLDLAVVDAPRTPYAESIRELRTSLSVLLDFSRTPVLVVTSSAPLDGKTLVTANLAASLALSGKRTIVVNGDLRKPRIHQFFGGQERDKGLADILVDPSSSAEEVAGLLRQTDIDGLSLLPAGHPHGDPADALAAKTMRRTIAAARELADIVIIDSPPVLAVADAAIIGSQCDGVLVVVRANKTSEKELAETIKRLQAGKVPVLGVALSRVKGVIGSVYGEYYRSASPDRVEDDDLSAASESEESEQYTSETVSQRSDAEPTLDDDAEPTLDADAEPTLDADAEPTLDDDAGVEPTLDADAEPTLDADAEPTLDADAEPTLDDDAEPTLDADTRPSSDQPSSIVKARPAHARRNTGRAPVKRNNKRRR